MQIDKCYSIEAYEINNKTYLVPHHQLKGCEKYFETKVPQQQKSYKDRKFYSEAELKDMEAKLTCGIKPKPAIKPEPKPQQAPENLEVVQDLSPVVEKRVRPDLRLEGPTHFINASVSKELKQIYENMLAPTIPDELLPLNSLHVNLLSFRLQKDADLDKWTAILKEIKKKKISLKGMGIIGQKDRYARRIYLNVEGMDDIVDTIVGKAIDRKLIEQDKLSRAKFDKKSQTYKSEKPYVTILKTKGKDLVDTKQYLPGFKTLVGPSFPITELKVSIINSYTEEQGFYDDRTITL